MSSPLRDIVVIGGSAGGVSVLSLITRALPPDFPGSLFVTLHIPPTAKSALPNILDRSALRCAPLGGHATIEPGRIYVAPPDHHLRIETGVVTAWVGPGEHGLRPAIDPMFRSAAIAYGPRVIGVVVTGTRNDGAAGLAIVKAHGGVAIVQDPADAAFPGLPKAALAHAGADHCVPAAEIAPLLRELVRAA